MGFAGRIACSGIAFLLMTLGNSGPRPTPLDSGTCISSEVPGETYWNEVKAVQQVLQDRGHDHGKIDGVFGLQTRASIRAFQKAENLPVNGQLDIQTSGRLGARPEGRKATGYDTTQDKPSAGINWARGSKRSGKTLQKPVKKWAQKVPPA
jgi:hypothetical protein